MVPLSSNRAVMVAAGPRTVASDTARETPNTPRPTTDIPLATHHQHPARASHPWNQTLLPANFQGGAPSLLTHHHQDRILASNVVTHLHSMPRECSQSFANGRLLAFYLAIENNKTVYSAGETVNGSLFLKTSRILSTPLLRVMFQGRIETKHQHAELGLHYADDVLPIFKTGIIIMRRGVIVCGLHEFRFQFNFPSEKLPASFDGAYGSIQYDITAEIFFSSGHRIANVRELTVPSSAYPEDFPGNDLGITASFGYRRESSTGTHHNTHDDSQNETGSDVEDFPSSLRLRRALQARRPPSSHGTAGNSSGGGSEHRFLSSMTSLFHGHQDNSASASTSQNHTNNTIGSNDQRVPTASSSNNSQSHDTPPSFPNDNTPTQTSVEQHTLQQHNNQQQQQPPHSQIPATMQSFNNYRTPTWAAKLMNDSTALPPTSVDFIQAHQQQQQSQDNSNMVVGRSRNVSYFGDLDNIYLTPIGSSHNLSDLLKMKTKYFSGSVRLEKRAYTTEQLVPVRLEIDTALVNAHVVSVSLKQEARFSSFGIVRKTTDDVLKFKVDKKIYKDLKSPQIIDLLVPIPSTCGNEPEVTTSNEPISNRPSATVRSDSSQPESLHFSGGSGALSSQNSSFATVDNSTQANAISSTSPIPPVANLSTRLNTNSSSPDVGHHNNNNSSSSIDGSILSNYSNTAISSQRVHFNPSLSPALDSNGTYGTNNRDVAPESILTANVNRNIGSTNPASTAPTAPISSDRETRDQPNDRNNNQAEVDIRGIQHDVALRYLHRVRSSTTSFPGGNHSGFQHQQSALSANSQTFDSNTSSSDSASNESSNHSLGAAAITCSSSINATNVQALTPDTNAEASPSSTVVKDIRNPTNNGESNFRTSRSAVFELGFETEENEDDFEDAHERGLETETTEESDTHQTDDEVDNGHRIPSMETFSSEGQQNVFPVEHAELGGPSTREQLDTAPLYDSLNYTTPNANDNNNNNSSRTVPVLGASLSVPRNYNSFSSLRQILPRNNSGAEFTMSASVPENLAAQQQADNDLESVRGFGGHVKLSPTIITPLLEVRHYIQIKIVKARSLMGPSTLKLRIPIFIAGFPAAGSYPDPSVSFSHNHQEQYEIFTDNSTTSADAVADNDPSSNINASIVHGEIDVRDYSSSMYITNVEAASPDHYPILTDRQSTTGVVGGENLTQEQTLPSVTSLPILHSSSSLGTSPLNPSITTVNQPASNRNIGAVSSQNSSANQSQRTGQNDNLTQTDGRRSITAITEGNSVRGVAQSNGQPSSQIPSSIDNRMPVTGINRGVIWNDSDRSNGINSGHDTSIISTAVITTMEPLPRYEPQSNMTFS